MTEKDDEIAVAKAIYAAVRELDGSKWLGQEDRMDWDADATVCIDGFFDLREMARNLALGIDSAALLRFKHHLEGRV